jgi:hypothetical protein
VLKVSGKGKFVELLQLAGDVEGLEEPARGATSTKEASISKRD